MIIDFKDTIVAPSTAPGIGALAMIRITGKDAINICNPLLSINLTDCATHSAHLVRFSNQDSIIDECVVTLFRAPSSYTSEDTVEISCHGSPFIVQQIIKALLKSGARMAEPGEFTQRAFINGQMDLAQAEAVGDLISSRTSAQHSLAMEQMRGGISKKIKDLRSELIEFASLIELENDFGEEDVEFADRTELLNKVNKVTEYVIDLKASFEYGNAIKEGLPVAIVGQPNVGKSTLLNALLNEERAIVSDIPGTTRDVIEDSIQIEGHIFRFIDTAGIRSTTDTVENLGIQRTFDQIDKAKIVLFLEELSENHKAIADQFKKLPLKPHQKGIILLTKSDKYDHSCHSYDIEEAVSTLTSRTDTILLSVKTGSGLAQLKQALVDYVASLQSGEQDIVISNLRHYQALQKTEESLTAVRVGLDSGIPSDLVALDLRHAMNHLGEISGQISTDDLLESIFSSFCIGK